MSVADDACPKCDGPEVPKLAPDPTGARPLDVALIGRPNAGKSSLFNALTGASAHVGNFPGVTVDVLEAELPLPTGGRARLFDLPGVYSLSPRLDRGSDEAQALACLERLEQSGAPFVVAQVVDATQLALSLRLTKELVARRVPLIVVLTQSDVLAKQGRSIDLRALSDALGAPVVQVSALSPDAKPKVLDAVVDRARNDERSEPREFDPPQLAARVETDRAGARERRRRAFTTRADRLLLHPLVGPILFVGLMSALFAAVFLVADPASNVIQVATDWLDRNLVAVAGDNWFTSLVGDGVLGGAGTVLAFLPQIVILTVAMELIEASGYLARGAFLVDRILRVAGLGGRSFVPLLTAHACAVPAITSTRIIRDPGERLRTMLVIPLMTCSARIPTYGLLIAAFFAGKSAWEKSAVFVALYFAGLAAGFVASLVIGRTVKKAGTALPLVLELPSYRMPRASVMLATVRRGSIRFVKEVGSGILVASLLLWILLKVPMPGAHLAANASSQERLHASIAANVGHAMEHVTRPAGFDWRIDVGLIASFGARELMVSTLGIIFGVEGDHASTIAEQLRPRYTLATALALMTFFIFACQCLSTVVALRRETKSLKWPAFVIGYTYVAAFVMSVVVYQVARALGA